MFCLPGQLFSSPAIPVSEFESTLVKPSSFRKRYLLYPVLVMSSGLDDGTVVAYSAYFDGG